MSDDSAKGAPAPRRVGPSYQELLAADSRLVPDVLASESYRSLGSEPIPAERYTSDTFFALEVERLWPRVWQMACREEDIPDVGDFHVYDIVGRSFLVVRGAPDRIRAYYNSCLHRGRRLATEDGHADKLRCGFHGWTWSLDGALQSMPCRWDFEHLDDAELALPEVRVETWGGFVFINMDPNAPSLADYLSILPDHFARWRLEDCVKIAHVAKVVRANWKIAQEAFMESYHVIATHPQILPVFADASAQYDVYGDHVNRNLGAFAATSPHLGEGRVAPDDVVAGMLSMWGRESTAARLEGARGARAALGDLNRRTFSRAFGVDHDDATDAELLDAIVYNVFPNFAPWGGFAPNIVYRWRPLGRQVDACIMEVMLLKRHPPDLPRPRPAPVHWLRDDEPWSAATELPILGPVIDQDMGNMPHVQEGLLASRTGKVQLGNYQEVRIRHFHQTLEKYLASG